MSGFLFMRMMNIRPVMDIFPVRAAAIYVSRRRFAASAVSRHGYWRQKHTCRGRIVLWTVRSPCFAERT